MYFVLRLDLKRIRFRNFRARCSLLFARKKERVLAKNQPKLGETKEIFCVIRFLIDSFVLCGWKTKKEFVI